MLPGGVGIIWFLFWLFLSYEIPASHPSISPEELKLITEAQGETAVIYEVNRQVDTASVPGTTKWSFWILSRNLDIYLMGAVADPRILIQGSKAVVDSGRVSISEVVTHYLSRSNNGARKREKFSFLTVFFLQNQGVIELFNPSVLC